MRVTSSIGEASVVPSAMALASKSVTEKYESIAMSMVDISYTFGLMIGPSLGGALYDFGGLYLPFLVTASMSLSLSLASLKLK